MNAMHLRIKMGFHKPISGHLVRRQNFARTLQYVVFNVQDLVISYLVFVPLSHIFPQNSLFYYFLGGLCVFRFCLLLYLCTPFLDFVCIFVFMYTLPPFLPWPLIPFVRLADRAPGTQITLRVSSQILRYTNIYKTCPSGEFLVISSRICGEYLPQIFVPTGSLITITDKENVHKNVNN